MRFQPRAKRKAIQGWTNTSAKAAMTPTAVADSARVSATSRSKRTSCLGFGTPFARKWSGKNRPSRSRGESQGSRRAEASTSARPRVRWPLAREVELALHERAAELVTLRALNILARGGWRPLGYDSLSEYITVTQQDYDPFIEQHFLVSQSQKLATGTSGGADVVRQYVIGK